MMRLPAVLPTAITLLVAAAPAAAQDPDVFSLEGLVITASPTPRAAEAVANHVTIISGDELRALSAGASVGEALRGVPGLEVVRNGSVGGVTSLFTRGAESDHTLVLVDGVQVNLPGGGFDFATLTVDNVERIEIVRGPASALYGSDAVAGVVHIVTRTGRGAARGSLALDAGSYGRRDVSADFESGTERAGWSMALARREGDGVLAFNNGSTSTVLSGQARLLPDDRTSLAVSLRVTDHEYHFPTDGSGAVVDTNAFTFSDATQLRLAVSRALGSVLSLEALVGVNEVDGGTDDAQDGPADTLGFYGFTSLDHFRRMHGELRAHVRLGEAVVTGGFEAEEERQRSFTESLSAFGPSSGRSASERGNVAGFAHASGHVGPAAVDAGARVEHNERFGRATTWQVGASWSVSERTGTRVRAAAGTSIKEPTFFENFATGFATGNPELDPERARSWEVGVEQPWLGGRVETRITWFDQRLHDLIQYTAAPPQPDDPSFFNIAEATSRGLEVDVGARLGAATLGASATWLDTEVTDAGFDAGAGATFVEGEPLMRRPTLSWSTRAAVGVGARVRLLADLRAVGERSDRDFTTFPATPVTLGAYTLLGAGAEISLPDPDGRLPAASITLRGENLLDEGYEEVLGFEAPGRALHVGLRVGVGGR